MFCKDGNFFALQMAFPLMCFLTFISSNDVVRVGGASTPSFDESYYITWGNDHASLLNYGTEIQLSLDKSSGAGFMSKKSYGSGFFHLRIKLPVQDSAGVVTAFYLTSHTNNHDELDFEFLGNRPGKPYTLQTNVFVNGVGNREQRTLLWFDPTADYHTYNILWNQHHIVFFVDNVPIREFKNNSNKGESYPSQQMYVEASIWDGDSWATDGGRTKTDWSHAPFKAYFQGFDIAGCPSDGNSNVRHCYSSSYWWNAHKFWELDSAQRRAYQIVRKRYMNYDYCLDRSRYPAPPPECSSQ